MKRFFGPTSFTALLAGVVFGIGLTLSGMTQPAKVIGFLDLFGNWDPSLAFVMGGAVIVHALTRPLVLRRKQPIAAPSFRLPSLTAIDGRRRHGRRATLALLGEGHTFRATVSDVISYISTLRISKSRECNGNLGRVRLIQHTPMILIQ